MKNTKQITDGKRPGTPIVKSAKPQPSKLDVTPKKSTKTDATVLETIPKEYFDGPANVMDHVLKILPENNAQLNDWFEDELHETERAFDIISEKLHNSVMDNLNSFVDGLGEVIVLGRDLQLCTILAKNGRRSINSAKEDILMGGLHTLAKYKRKKGYQAFLKVLLGVRYLVGVGKSLDRALDNMDYPQALQICYDCKNMLPQYQDITALKPIIDKLKNQLTTIEERLDSSLTEICRTFNGAAYERILVAYFVLSRGPKAGEQLKMNFTEMVNSASKNVVYSHALLSESNAMQAETLKRSAKFRDLCASVPTNQYMPCFQTILEVMSDVMFAHYTIYQWHMGVSIAHAKLDHEVVEEEREKIEYFDSIRDTLLQIKPGVWDNIQNKVAVFLSGIQLTVLKIDEFLRMWSLLNIFMEIGEEFSGSDSNSLRTTLKHVSKTYFTAYHKSKLETLRTMLENDAWAKCPVSKRFQVKFVYERELQNFAVPPQLEVFRRNSEKYKSVFMSFENDGNPFSLDYKGLNNRPAVLRMNTFEELLVDPNDDASDSANDSEDEPMITTTAINAIRWLGSYMKIIQELQPIAFEVFQGIIQIVEYFMYTVFSFFGEESEEMPMVLKAMIYKFRKSFGETTESSPMLSSSMDRLNQIKAPQLSMVDVSDPNDLFGLSYRTVAFQSLLFLQEAMNVLKSDLAQHLPKAQREKNLNDFYTNTIDAIPDLVNYMYHTLAFKFVDYKQLTEMIEKTKWDTKELGAENSPYVDFLLREYDNFAKRLARVKDMGTVPPKIQNILWDQALLVTMEQLVDGYAKIKKCTNEGRAIMSLDLRTFQTSVQKMSPIKPIPHVPYVEGYIKAFYISSESDFLNWCKDHTEYPLKYLLSLANVGIGTTMKKAARTTLLQHIEEVDKVRKRAAAVQQ